MPLKYNRAPSAATRMGKAPLREADIAMAGIGKTIAKVGNRTQRQAGNAIHAACTRVQQELTYNKTYEILLLCCVVSNVDSTMKLIVDLVANLGFGGNTPGTPDKEDIFWGSNNAQ